MRFFCLQHVLSRMSLNINIQLTDEGRERKPCMGVFYVLGPDVILNTCCQNSLASTQPRGHPYLQSRQQNVIQL